MATARNLLRVPEPGLLAFCLFSRSSVLRLTALWSVHTNDTCILVGGHAGRPRARSRRSSAAPEAEGSRERRRPSSGDRRDPSRPREKRCPRRLGGRRVPHCWDSRSPRWRHRTAPRSRE
ncbi:hypothetical protein AAFF_G00395120 [Aldrovandia affinis]|uniref:Uncharacterized protein n=1 Tax=Aldrovandia affinis TaxID=143900 RepID=A0AAD7SE89_9TELE|nr:hypothetical protein AAFF_G00395120 [Aldrovandia affinis]